MPSPWTRAIGYSSENLEAGGGRGWEEEDKGRKREISIILTIKVYL